MIISEFKIKEIMKVPVIFLPFLGLNLVLQAISSLKCFSVPCFGSSFEHGVCPVLAQCNLRLL